MMNYAGSLYWEPISLLLTLCCLTKLNFETDSKAKPPPFVLIRFYAGKRICRVSCGKYAGNSFMPWRYPAMHSSGPPCNTLVWWSRKVCKISSHSLQAFTIVSVGRFCLWNKKPCVHASMLSLANHLNNWLFAAASAREKGQKKGSGGPGGIDFTGTCTQIKRTCLVSTFWEGIIKAKPCGRKPPVPSVS